MNLYKVLEPIELHRGIVELTQDQVMQRMRYLKSLKNNKYDVKGPVYFKRGEIIGLTPDTAERLTGCLEMLTKSPTNQKGTK
jgi:hypothetical protein